MNGRNNKPTEKFNIRMQGHAGINKLYILMDFYWLIIKSKLCMSLVRLPMLRWIDGQEGRKREVRKTGRKKALVREWSIERKYR